MEFSIWPLVAASAAASALGYLWFHPRVFGGLWMRMSGMTPEMIERGAAHRHLFALGSFVTLLVVAFVMRTLMNALALSDAGSGMQLAALLWVGFAAPILLGSVLWEHRPLVLYLVNVCYWLFALSLMAAILSV